MEKNLEDKNPGRLPLPSLKEYLIQVEKENFKRQHVTQKKHQKKKKTTINDIDEDDDVADPSHTFVT